MATDNNSNNPANSGLGDPDDRPDGDVDIAEAAEADFRATRDRIRAKAEAELAAEKAKAAVAASALATPAEQQTAADNLTSAQAASTAAKEAVQPSLGASQGNESSPNVSANTGGPATLGDIEGSSERKDQFFEQLKKNIEVYIGEKVDRAIADTDITSLRQVAAQTGERPAGMAASAGDFPLTQGEYNSISEPAIISGLDTIMYVNQFNGTKGVNLVKDPLPDVDLKKLIRYGEDKDGSFPTFVLDQLVYIQGVDISKYLKGSLSISKSNVSGHNTLTFTLDNAHDQFVWTERNLAGPVFGRNYYYDSHGERREYSAAETLTFGLQVQLSPEEVAAAKRSATNSGSKAFLPFESLKKKVFDYKGNPEINPISVDASNNLVFPRFDLVPNKCIFARMDPIRVWSLYPFRPRGQKIPSDQELWMPEFTGFIEAVSIEDDDVLGTSTITIECSDIRQSVLQKMRISSSYSSSLAAPLDEVGFRPLSEYDEGTRPVAYVPNATASSFVSASERASFRSGPGNLEARQAIQSSLLGNKEERFFSPQKGNLAFYDDILNSPFGTPIPPYEDVEKATKTLLVFNRQAAVQGRARVGVNNIEFGGTFLYNPGANLKTSYLEQYHAFCLFGPKRRPWTLKEVAAVGAETTTTGKFWPLNARLWFLLPATGTGPKNLADLSAVDSQMVHQIDWTTRMEVLRTLIEQLDYQMFVSGTGDIHVELPLADHRPEDFGEFKQAFRFNKATISTSYGDESEEPVTGIIVETGFAIGNATVPGDKFSIAKATLQTVFAFSPYIAGRYGINIAQPIPLPFLMANDLPIAQQRAIIELQKANARCNTLQFQSSFRPFLLPNRPVHHVRRSRMGIIVSVETTFEIGAQPKATVSIGLEHVRTWTGGYFSGVLNPVPPEGGAQRKELTDRDTAVDQRHGTSLEDNQIEDQVFTTVMGGVNTPTSTKALWGSDSLLVANSGVHVLDLTKPLKRPPENVVPAPVHVNARELGATEVAVETPTVENTKKFASNPLAMNKARSPFGPRNTPREDGTVSTFHHGVDFDTETVKPTSPSSPTEVYAVHNGTAVANSYNNKVGYTITLSAKNGLTAEYFHLAPDRIDPSKKGDTGYQAAVDKAKRRGRNDAQQKYNFSKGDTTEGPGPTFGSLPSPFYMIDGVHYPVKAGDLIGFASNTGTAVASSRKNPGVGAGTHLHFEVKDGGNLVDPVPYLPGPISGKTKASK